MKEDAGNPCRFLIEWAVLVLVEEEIAQKVKQITFWNLSHVSHNLEEQELGS